MEATTTYTDRELVYLIKQENKKAFDYLYTRYSNILLFVIKKVIADEHIAEDILQDTFVNIWRGIAQFDPQRACLYTWMRNVAKNRAIDFTRGSVYNMRARTNDGEMVLKQLNAFAEQKTDKIGLSQLVTQLPARHSTLIQLFYFGGHSAKEIALYLNLPLGTIKTRLRSAISALRKDFAYNMHDEQLLPAGVNG